MAYDYANSVPPPSEAYDYSDPYDHQRSSYDPYSDPYVPDHQRSCCDPYDPYDHGGGSTAAGTSVSASQPIKTMLSSRNNQQSSEMAPKAKVTYDEGKFQVGITSILILSYQCTIGLKQKCSQVLTPFSGEVFHVLFSVLTSETTLDWSKFSK